MLAIREGANLGRRFASLQSPRRVESNLAGRRPYLVGAAELWNGGES
jgi:hypothetical protein